ncbi:bifunctional nuclease family protein [Aliifodinibius sp. S!AR15-10]|uniref:bifunctional nuclease family protein n=1 Tax=Aliifodinibius sp. S!AR15-10 TaxID=2950437 RepID=UPI00285A043F|nr:bifunctional nuclease family protein [Aliifodinibius sp. S!AR15-10]MDR8392356.1 bifunctional nuclease family protein [Aliifodinibius sp. S!AR15-10]
MEILGLSTSPSSGGAYALILNEVHGNRRLPIIIGTFEAQAIALELEHIKPPRPMTHDLLKNVIQSFGAEMDQVFINDLSEGTFYAQIIYNKNGEHLELDARPSDAIALAIRFNASIYVADTILEEAGIISESEEAEGSISSLREEKPASEMTKLEKLENELQTAIDTENYEKAARLRDEIKKLKG